MKVAAMLAAVREAMKYARMENAEFGSITRHQGDGPTAPVRNSAGEIVTEANVSDFIRERVALHHGSWVIGTLETVVQELMSETPHTYVSAYKGFESSCEHCGKQKSHRSHVK